MTRSTSCFFRGWPKNAIMRTERVRVRGGIVRLRPGKRSDAAPWSRARLRDREPLTAVEPTISETWEESSTRKRYRRLLSAAKRMEAERTALVSTVEVDGRFAGELTLGGIRGFPSSVCWVGYWISSEFAGGGVGTAAVALAVDYARALGIHRIEATVLPENGASRKVLSRCGFREEGLARELFNIDGRWRDHILVARLADDAPVPVVSSLERSGHLSVLRGEES